MKTLMRLFTIVPLLCIGMVMVGCDRAEVEQAKEKAKDAAETAKDAAADAKDSAEAAAIAAGDAAKDAGTAVGDAAKDATDRVSAGFSAVTEKASETLKSVEGGGAMLTEIKEMFSSAMETLRGITDKASAEAALPKLEELNTKAEQMAESTAKFPEEGMSAVGKVVEAGIEELKALADKLMSNPEIQEVIKPKVDALIDNLKKMTGA